MGKTAVVVGHTSGLGRSIADAMLDRGDQVIGFARSTSPRQSADLIQYRVDLSRQADLESLVTTVERECPGFDVIVLAAGALSAHPPEEPDYADAEYLLAVNVLAPLYITGALLSRIEENDADVVTVSSSSVAEYYPVFGAYSASKAALTKLTDDLRRRLQDSSARVIELCPSGFTSNLYATMGGAKVLRDESAQIDVDDLVRLVLFALDLPKRVEVGRLVVHRKR